ncbi:MAG: hypothetical protein ACI4TW_05835 [Prevotella sp.]
MILDFFFAALPWVSCGLMMAVIAVGSYSASKIKAEGDKEKGLRRRAISFYIASVLMYFTAAMLHFAKDCGMSSSVVWVSIGSMFLCFGSVDMMKSNGKSTDQNETEDK